MQRFYLFIVSVLFLSCVRDLDRPGWDTKVLAPVAKGYLNVFDFIPDSLQRVEDDGGITIVYRQSILQFGLDSLINIDVTPYIQNLKLTNLSLPNQSFNINRSLGQIYPTIKPLHNLTLPIFTGLTTSVPNQEFDAGSFFKSLTVEKGFIDVKLVNKLPIDMNNIEYTIRNKISGDILLDSVINTVPKDDSVTQTFFIGNKTIESLLDISISNIELAAGIGVRIDTTDNIKLGIQIRDLELIEAEAIFPAQNVIEDSSDVPLLGLKNAKLTKAVVKNGVVRVRAVSTIQDSIFMTYTIPNASYLGDIFQFEDILKPAQPNDVTTADSRYSFDQYDIDLRGKDLDTVNAFFNVVIGRIDSTGKVVRLSKNDSIDVRVEVEQFKPSYVEGFLGNDTLSLGPDTIDFTGLEELEQEGLNLVKAKVMFVISNGIGADAELEIKKLSSINNTGMITDISGDVLETSHSITRASKATATETRIELNEENSNIVNVLNGNPNKIIVEAINKLNPNVSNGSFSDFADEKMPLDISMDIEIPFEVQFESIILEDTSDLDLGGVSTDNFKSGQLKFIVENTYPFEGELKAIFINENGVVLDEATFDKNITAGQVGNSGKVELPSKSTLLLPVDQNRLLNLTEARKVLFRAAFINSDRERNIKVYSHYGMDVKIVADVVINPS